MSNPFTQFLRNHLRCAILIAYEYNTTTATESYRQ